MAAIGEAPTLFLRKATGLVKGWSKFDAFLYSFMSVNFVTLGLFFALSVLAFVPTGQVLPALLISGVFVTFLVITYAGLISVMPRAGGDYVWQSRVMGGGIAFVLAVTGWWFILWYWAPIYGNILNVEVLQPLAATFKWDGLTDWLATDNGLFVVILATVVLAGYLVSLGMEGYAKVQKVCGMWRLSPPMRCRSCSSCMPWITEPAPRKSSALKKACVTRWKIAAVKAPVPRPRNM